MAKVKTAYAPSYDCRVTIVRQYNDERGVPILVGRNKPLGIHDFLFREIELSDFKMETVPNTPKKRAEEAARVHPTMMQIQAIFAAICDSDCPTPLAMEVVRVGSNNGLPALWIDVESEYMPVVFELGDDGTVYCNGDSRW